MEPEIEFSVKLTEADVVGANYELTQIRWWRVCLIGGGALSIVGVALFFRRPEWNVAAYGFLLGLLLVYFGTVVPWMSRRITLRDFRRNPAAQVSMHYRIFDDHFTVASEDAKSELRWQSVIKTKQSRNYLALYLSPKILYVIPFRHLTSEQSTQLRDVVKTRVPARVI
jgi:hypothetical protein